MKVRGVIFDLDGTLLDSMQLWEGIGEAYLLKLGLNPSPNLREELKTMSMSQAALYLRREYGILKSPEEIISGIHDLASHQYCHEIGFKPSAFDLIKKFSGLGIRMCIATASDRTLVEAALERLDALQYFCGVVTCAEVGEGKDQPLIYEKALEILKTNKGDTLVFEDALYAIETAKRAGFFVVGVYDDSSKKNWEEIKEKAYRVIESFNMTDAFDGIEGI